MQQYKQLQYIYKHYIHIIVFHSVMSCKSVIHFISKVIAQPLNSSAIWHLCWPSLLKIETEMKTDAAPNHLSGFNRYKRESEQSYCLRIGGRERRSKERKANREGAIGRKARLVSLDGLSEQPCGLTSAQRGGEHLLMAWG